MQINSDTRIGWIYLHLNYVRVSLMRQVRGVCVCLSKLAAKR